jgi:hypothetical protein
MGSAIASGTILNPRSSFSRVALLTLVCLVFFLYTFRSTTTKNRIEPFETESQVIYVQNGNQSRPLDCTLNATHLQSLQWRYGLEENIDYGRRYIRFQRDNIARASTTLLTALLVQSRWTFRLQDRHIPALWMPLIFSSAYPPPFKGSVTQRRVPSPNGHTG